MCKHTNISQATSADWEAVCADCGKTVRNEAMSKEFEYRGVKVTPTYRSKNGTGRQCETVQGWVFHGSEMSEQSIAVARIQADLVDVEDSARSVLDELTLAVSCESLEDLQANLEAAYANCKSLLAEIKEQLKKAKRIK